MTRTEWEHREAIAKQLWFDFCAHGFKPADIPERPDLAYGKEWRGWADWLGWNEGAH